MHGQYRAPGGKLVAAYVEVADGGLARVRISGTSSSNPTMRWHASTPR
jgi:hypothetical protein